MRERRARTREGERTTCQFIQLHKLYWSKLYYACDILPNYNSTKVMYCHLAAVFSLINGKQGLILGREGVQKRGKTAVS
jgi:hypothetical protein